MGSRCVVSAFLIIAKQVPDKTGTDPRAGPGASQAMEPAANKLAPEKSADHDGKRNELPAQARQHPDGDHEGHGRVYGEKPGK